MQAEHMTLEECKFLLLNCAKELYMNANLRNNINQNLKKSHRRGLSDPFDYFTKEVSHQNQ